VSRVFAAYPPLLKPRLLALRNLIFATAQTCDGVGKIEEALRWGEPAYLTPESRSGSTIRLGWHKKQPSHYALYFNCKTSLVTEFRLMFADQLTLVGNRAILFAAEDELPTDIVAICIAAALTYHHDKRLV
jgi:hypothetical protein